MPTRRSLRSPSLARPLRPRLAAALSLALLAACTHTPDPEPGPLGKHVDPFVGTGGIPWAQAMLFPGATTPFGLVRLSPDTCFPGGLTIGNMATAGYWVSHPNLFGFSHTRLSGTGSSAGGQLRVRPSVGDASPVGRDTHPLAISHADEKASPGYYGTWIPELSTLAELTATTHAGVHRYTFAPGAEGHLWLDVTSTLNGGHAEQGHVEVHAAEQEVVGQARIFSGFWRNLPYYFVARVNQPIASFGTWKADDYQAGRDTIDGGDVGADLGFAPPASTTTGVVVELQVGLSFVSLENARANLDAEAAGKTFDQVYAAARDVWEAALGKIQAESSDEVVLTNFYTSLYHSLIMPTNFTDVNGEYLGFGEQVGFADGFTYRTDLSIWDTFRTEHPLLNLIAADVQRDSLKSLVRMARVGGSLPRWPSGDGYTGSMFGTPSDMVVAESYLKGLTDFEVEEAYSYMKVTALGPAPSGADGRDGIERCLDLGYCPNDEMDESVSRTLEYAWADGAIAGLAAALGHDDEAALFTEHSQWYRNIWNPATRYFDQRNADGSFFEPLLPEMSSYVDALFGNYYVRGYVEGSPKEWRWSVPHDPQGMISLFGSPDYFVSELDSFITRASPTRAAVYPGADYWHGNQHDIHAIYLFDEAGRPELTQKWVRWALDTRYADAVDGLDGNDDGGTLSAWYVLSALGFYPVGGTDKYWVGAPNVERAELVLPGGEKLIVIADDQSAENVYVQSVTLNGQPMCEPAFRHDAIAGGATFRFEMGPAPAPGGGFGCG